MIRDRTNLIPPYLHPVFRNAAQSAVQNGNIPASAFVGVAIVATPFFFSYITPFVFSYITPFVLQQLIKKQKLLITGPSNSTDNRPLSIARNVLANSNNIDTNNTRALTTPAKLQTPEFPVISTTVNPITESSEIQERMAISKDRDPLNFTELRSKSPQELYEILGLDNWVCDFRTQREVNEAINKIIQCFKDKGRTLNLAKMRLLHIPEECFSYLPQLEELDVSLNELSSISLKHLPQLRTLKASENYLQSIDLSQQPELIDLNLHGNFIQSIDLSWQDKLKRLNLLSNLLQHIALKDPSKFENLSLDQTLQISTLENSNKFPVRSTTESLETQKEIAIPRVVDPIYLNDLRCKSPEEISKILGLDNWVSKYNTEGAIKEAKKRIIDCFKTNSRTLILTSLGLKYLPKECFSFLPQLENLFLNDNQLSSVNLEHLTQLRRLNASNNRLRNIDLSRQTQLTKLDLSENYLQSIDLSQQTQLVELDLHMNLLLTIALKHQSKLKNLSLSRNLLQNIDLSALENLEEANIAFNCLKTIHLSQQASLKMLWVHSNQIKEIDLRRQTVLEYLSIHANLLEFINLSSQTKLKHLSLYSNPLGNPPNMTMADCPFLQSSSFLSSSYITAPK